MKIQNGVDIVFIPRFKQILNKNREEFLNRHFTKSEIDYAKNDETLAGFFAAKEAIFKAGGIEIGEWKKAEIFHDKNGKPYVEFSEDVSVSISHDGDYVIAFVIIVNSD